VTLRVGLLKPPAADATADCCRGGRPRWRRATTSALGLFGALSQQNRRNAKALAGGGALLALGHEEQALAVLDSAPDKIKEAGEVAAARSAVEVEIEGRQARAKLADFEGRIAADADDHAARIELAVALNASGEREAAVDALIEAIRRDRAWNEEAARKQLLKFFEAWGFADPATRRGGASSPPCCSAEAAGAGDDASLPSAPVRPAAEIAVFPLPGVLLLPQGRLPLNVFEPRYPRHGLDSLEHGRMFGMIQPDPRPPRGEGGPGFLRHRLPGARLGLQRDRGWAAADHPDRARALRRGGGMPMAAGGYRRVRADYAPFAADLDAWQVPVTSTAPGCSGRSGSISAPAASRRTGKAVEAADDAALVTSLATLCPSTRRRSRRCWKPRTARRGGDAHRPAADGRGGGRSAGRRPS